MQITGRLSLEHALISLARILPGLKRKIRGRSQSMSNLLNVSISTFSNFCNINYLLFKVMGKALVAQSLYFFTLMILGLLEEFQSL